RADSRVRGHGSSSDATCSRDDDGGATASLSAGRPRARAAISGGDAASGLLARVATGGSATMGSPALRASIVAANDQRLQGRPSNEERWRAADS
ncbi:hypothetical protein Dimus_036235, partial [Dionaea muscipula]